MLHTLFRRWNKHMLLCSAVLFFLLTVVFSACKKEDDAQPQPSGTEEGEELSGGRATVMDQSVNAFGHSVPGLSMLDQSKFVVGNSFFRDNWVVAPSSTTSRDGLGPFLNSNSCSGCHTLDGRGRPPLQSEPLTSMLVRLSVAMSDAHGGPMEHPTYGGQLSGNAIPGVNAEGDVLIHYLDVYGNFDDGTQYILRKPVYEFINLQYGSLDDVLFSPRVAQQLPGLGLLEAVDESTLLSFADEQDANGDGISGRPNYVWDVINNKTSIGRFGWKANQPGLRQQTAAAFLGDIGITSSVFPDENLTDDQAVLYAALMNGGSPEISDDLLDKVVYYTSALAVPARRGWTNGNVVKGKQLFLQAGCGKCHIPFMQTGAHPSIAELSNQPIRPYTDLLLHDMGPGLADGRPDFLATGTEWRTPPLWGIGMIQVVNGHTFFLHDGRARNLQEAILWHGGEGEQSKNVFKAMTKTDREALLAFLESL